jgi:hypothetical protein
MRKKLIFFAGDIRREHCPFGFAWGKYEHLIDYDEASIASWVGSMGYIGLHRNRGDFSNKAITGFMKHAWLFDGNHNIIEAVSEGVLDRHPFHALLSDYVVILKPVVCEKAMMEAVKRGKWISELKLPYDDHFRFDLEIEESLFADKEIALANMRQYSLGVSCTELVALCYVGHRRELGLYRTKAGSRQVILPDAYLSTHFEVVWASKHTTPDNALMLGLHEEGCSMLREYWEQREKGGI